MKDKYITYFTSTTIIGVLAEAENKEEALNIAKTKFNDKDNLEKFYFNQTPMTPIKTEKVN